jgi:hypothetical protein
LKAYKTVISESKDPHDRWLCAVSSPQTEPGYDLRDTYIKDIIQAARAAGLVEDLMASIKARLQEEMNT